MSIVYDAFATHDGGLSFAELLRRPSWQKDAACADYPREMFFPTRGESLDPARRVCDGCLVKTECLAYALEAGKELMGFWAGTSHRERMKMRNPKPRGPRLTDEERRRRNAEHMRRLRASRQLA